MATPEKDSGQTGRLWTTRDECLNSSIFRDPANEGPELPHIDIQRELKFGGRVWQGRLSRLCPRRSVSLQLDEVFLCDGRDLCNRPVRYRLHMYPGASSGQELSFEEKHERMRGWQQAILTFDHLMEAEPCEHSIETLTELLLMIVHVNSLRFRGAKRKGVVLTPCAYEVFREELVIVETKRLDSC